MSGRSSSPTISADQVREQLKSVKFPGFSRDIVSFGIVKSVAVSANNVTVNLQVTSRDEQVPARLRADAEAALRQIAGVGDVRVDVALQQPPQSAMPTGAVDASFSQPKIEGVKSVVAVGSGKGGVGKSTVAVNLACALSQLDHAVGVMDADIYGPSVPKMLGSKQRPTVTDERLDPVENFGLKMMSMAFLLDESSPVIWRGPMIMKAIQQFVRAVNWGTLDVLIVDLPPGTGDAQLSLVQTIAVDGGVVVTTPQDVALDVARRGIAMFERVNIRLLGIIENMSYYICPHCNERDDVFGHGGGRIEAERLEVPFLGEIPLYTDIRVCGDQGTPVVMAHPDSKPAAAFRQCAGSVWEQLQRA